MLQYKPTDSTLHAGQIAQLATALLKSLSQPDFLTDHSCALQMLSILRPGLFGCVAMPRATDPVKPSAKIKDSAVAIFQGLSADLHPVALKIIQDCILRAPDKAPLRNTVAEATTNIAAKLSSACQSSWLNFIAIALFSPQPATRLLALQSLELMIPSIIADSLEDQARGVRNAFL